MDISGLGHMYVYISMSYTGSDWDTVCVNGYICAVDNHYRCIWVIVFYIWSELGQLLSCVSSLCAKLSLINAQCNAYFGLLLLCSIDDGGAAYFSNLAAFTIERPTADLISKHIFDKQDPAIKSQHKFVKQFNVLQQVVIRVTVHRERQIISHKQLRRLISTLHSKSKRLCYKMKVRWTQ